MKNFTERIKNWNREIFGNIIRRKRRCQVRLNGIQRSLSRAPSHRLQKLEKELIVEYNTILEQEEIMWHQRAKVEWLKYGDGNTKFFHLSTVIRRRKNTIQSLKDEQERWQEDPDTVRSIVVNSSRNCTVIETNMAMSVNFIASQLCQVER